MARGGVVMVPVVVSWRGGGDLRRIGCGWGVSGISRAKGRTKSFD